MKNILILLFLAVGLISCDKESFVDINPSVSGGQSGSTASMITYERHMYILDNRTLITMQLDDPSNPVETSRLDVGSGAETLFAYNGNLYIGTRTGLLIYSLADQAKPVFAGTNIHIYSKDPVVVKGIYAYLTRKNGTEDINPSGVLQVINVASPQSSFTIWLTDQPYPSGLAIQDDYLYVCNGKFGISVFSLDDPQLPVYLTRVQDKPVYDCIPDGDLLICQGKDGILLYDISDRTQPIFIKAVK